MKQIFTLILFTGSVLSVSAQQLSRIIAAQSDRHNGTTWAPYDSTYLYYKPGNTTPGDADSFLQGMGKKLHNDSASRFFYYMGSYINTNRFAYTYNAQGYLAEVVTQQFVTSSSTWRNQSRELYTYDANNNNTELVTQNWNTTTNAWDNVVRYVNTYTGNDLTSELSQIWYSSSSSWVNNNERLFTYSGGKLMTKIFRVWNTTTSAWVNYSKDDYTYHTNGKVESTVTQAWFAHLANWRTTGRIMTVFNVANLDSVVTAQNWDTAGGVYVNSWRYRYVFNASNTVIGDTTDNWNTGSNTWGYSTAGTTVNDTLSYRYNWDVTSSSFMNANRSIVAYNSHKQLTKWIRDSWNATTSTWGMNNDRYERYYYTMADLGVANASQNVPICNLYPVPANSVVNLQATWKAPTSCKIAIHDMSGRVLRQWQEPVATNIARTIPVADMANGIYTITITGDRARAARQFVISR